MQEIEIFRWRNDNVIVGRDLCVEVLMLIAHNELIREVTYGCCTCQEFLIFLWRKIVLDDIAQSFGV